MKCGKLAIGAIAFLSVFCAQCYVLRGNSGGADVSSPTPRTFDAHAISVPAGYHVDLIASGLTFPTGITLDTAGKPYILESGYAYGERWTTPRLLLLDGGVAREIARGERNSAPWTGVTFFDGAFYVAAGGVLGGGQSCGSLRPGQCSL